MSTIDRPSDLTDYLCKRYADTGGPTRDCDCKGRPTVRMYHREPYCVRCGLRVSRETIEEWGS